MGMGWQWEGKGDCKGGDNGGGKGDGDGDGDGDGKASVKGGTGKGKFKMVGYQPNHGDVLYFIPKHDNAFYDSFPDGKEVNSKYHQIDYNQTIMVILSMSDTLNTDHDWHGPRTFKYVAVSFRPGSGYIVWTDFSRNGVVWIRFP